MNLEKDMAKMSKIAIITARGGSQRIPRKNIKEFCGQPIIGYSIQAALESGLFSEVMVSTDDEEIAEVAKSFGANVPFLRSKENADHFATTAAVVKEVLECYKEMGKEFTQVACIYPTAPFVTSKTLIEAFDKMEEVDTTAVFPVVKFSFPPQRGLIDKNGYISYQYPEYASTRSQDLESVFHDCGQFYLVDVETFLTEETLITKKAKAIIIQERLVQDIDTMEDWEMAEIKYKKFVQNKGE
ncbi:MAG: pseudaminic acid cytidylyltransferase [Lachnospiraceae bacterium]